MIFRNERSVVSEVHVDDGTTGGKTVYIDSQGDWWEATCMTKESHGTADTIATMEQGKIVF